MHPGRQTVPGGGAWVPYAGGVPNDTHKQSLLLISLRHLQLLQTCEKCPLSRGGERGFGSVWRGVCGRPETLGNRPDPPNPFLSLDTSVQAVVAKMVWGRGWRETSADLWPPIPRHGMLLI
jgi:hypothetical protein